MNEIYLNPKEYKRGVCFICGGACIEYAHFECCSAIELLRTKRINFLIEKYGEGTKFQNKLVAWGESEKVK